MPTTLMDTQAAAEWLGLRPGTLRRKRCEGTGPRFVVLGGGNGSVRYRITANKDSVLRILRTHHFGDEEVDTGALWPKSMKGPQSDRAR